MSEDFFQSIGNSPLSLVSFSLQNYNQRWEAALVHLTLPQQTPFNDGNNTRVGTCTGPRGPAGRAAGGSEGPLCGDERNEVIFTKSADHTSPSQLRMQPWFARASKSGSEVTTTAHKLDGANAESERAMPKYHLLSFVTIGETNSKRRITRVGTNLVTLVEPAGTDDCYCRKGLHTAAAEEVSIKAVSMS